MSALRLVVVGAGANVWQFHARGIEAVGAEVVAVHDVDRGGAERVAAELDCSVAGSLDELLRLDADVAVVLAPHVEHAEITLACLRAGLHVLVEKPIAITAEEADRMVDEAERHGLLLAVALQQRTRSEVQEAQTLIQTGALGEVQRVDLLATWPRRSSYFDTAPWRGSWRGEGGGILVNQGQHDLDLVCHLVGSPASVTARTRTEVHPIETEETAAALLEWPNGALGSIHVSIAEADEQQRLEVTGTSGRLRLTPGRLELLPSSVDFRAYAASDGDPYGPPEAGEPLVREGSGGTHVELYENLASALERGEPLVAPGRDAARTIELANALILSGRLRREVALPLDRAVYADVLRALRGLDGPSAREVENAGKETMV